ncbi:hypothetical protein FB45DRAFT_930020 [Roridomyces roridus]|uniref:EF-hand domain-containing protein n=1 Tax=Roridomyces roridus TaxID=1738132 RepID=A0AAD7FF73_9AGAR|nr:hypothetical protein FB45DRAFT_930020 [Roridomyces roridus]
MSTNQHQVDDWKRMKLTAITEEDGVNNYNEFKYKSELDLDAAGYWQYVDRPAYNPPVIPKLKRTEQIHGVDANGAAATITIPGNEAAVAAAEQQARAWLDGDKKALAIIARAVPSAKLYVVKDCKSAHEAWKALKNEYEPANAIAAVTIKQQILSFQCGAHDNPVEWRQTIVQLYQKLRDTDPLMMPDNEFAKHLVTLMTTSEAWRYCRDLERAKVETREMPFQAPTRHSRQTRPIAETKNLTSDRLGALLHLATNNAPNKYCETPRGHLIEDCFSYGGGKVGRYPDSFKGKRDVHLAPEARTAARHKQALESGPGDRFAGMVEYEDDDMEEEEDGAGAGDRFTGMIDHTEDAEKDVEKVIGTVGDAFAFMMRVGSDDEDDDDKITPDEFVQVHATVCGADVAQDDSINHDTGASRHIFNKESSFDEYTACSPLLLCLKCPSYSNGALQSHLRFQT